MVKAEQLIDTFSKKPYQGAFRHLSRKTVAEQLSARVAAPYLINQGGAGLCAGAAIIYGIARHSPVEYVRMVTELFDYGKTRLHKWVLEPCADLKSYNLPTRRVPEADWLILASIRDSENWFIDYQKVTDFGGANIYEFLRWVKKAGYTDVREDWNHVMNKTPENLYRASELYEKNYHVCLLIDACALGSEKAFISRPNHWVVLRSNITTTGSFSGPVNMQVFTWGSLRKMPKGRMKVDDFVDYYYGYVAAKY